MSGNVWEWTGSCYEGDCCPPGVPGRFLVQPSGACACGRSGQERSHKAGTLHWGFVSPRTDGLYASRLSLFVFRGFPGAVAPCRSFGGGHRSRRAHRHPAGLK
jgi:hypothetical protein